MAKSLVIVESPAKARTIARYLGSGYRVMASMGHVRDLPRTELGVDVEDGFKPKYVTIRGKGKAVAALRAAAKNAAAVYMAVDQDREGEAIAWHLQQLLKVSDEKLHRVMFNEITRGAIKRAFQSPAKIDMPKVGAQQARRILDRLVGYMLSPLLWKKICKGLSAGRVQSVAARLIVEREREIEQFVPEEFWRVTGYFRRSPEEEPFKALLARVAVVILAPQMADEFDMAAVGRCRAERLQRAIDVLT